MKQVLRFLHSLSLHNDKVWFDTHKADYLKAKNKVDELAVKLIEGIRSFDDAIGPLTVADCTYRIYRDVRFSKDKSPYKTHMGVFVNRGGKSPATADTISISTETATICWPSATISPSRGC